MYETHYICTQDHPTTNSAAVSMRLADCSPAVRLSYFLSSCGVYPLGVCTTSPPSQTKQCRYSLADSLRHRTPQAKAMQVGKHSHHYPGTSLHPQLKGVCVVAHNVSCRGNSIRNLVRTLTLHTMNCGHQAPCLTRLHTPKLNPSVHQQQSQQKA
jgi:hypothetical protein